jgi:hypothetical protein
MQSIDQLFDSGGSLVNNVVGVVDDVVEGTGKFAENAGGAVIDVIDGGVDGVTDSVSQGVDTVTDRTSDAVEEVTDAVDPVVTEFTDAVSEGVDGVTDAVSEATDTVTDAVSEGAEWVDEVFSDPDAAVSSGVDTVANTIGDVVPEIDAVTLRELEDLISSFSSNWVARSVGGGNKSQDGIEEIGSFVSEAAGSVVCTAMVKELGFGQFRSVIWRRFGKDRLTEYHTIGYHTMFIPLVHYAFQTGDSRPQRLVKNILMHIARHRTVDLRAVMHGGKRDWLGVCYRAVLEPLCYLVGRIKAWTK